MTIWAKFFLHCNTFHPSQLFFFMNLLVFIIKGFSSFPHIPTVIFVVRSTSFFCYWFAYYQLTISTSNEGIGGRNKQIVAVHTVHIQAITSVQSPGNYSFISK